MHARPKESINHLLLCIYIYWKAFIKAVMPKFNPWDRLLATAVVIILSKAFFTNSPNSPFPLAFFLILSLSSCVHVSSRSTTRSSIVIETISVLNDVSEKNPFFFKMESRYFRS